MPARTITAVSRGGIVVPHTGNGRPRGDRPLSYHLYRSVCRLDPAGPISDLRKIRTRDHHYAPPPHRADNRLQRDAPSLSPTPLLPLMGPIGEVAAHFVEVRSLGHGGLDLLRLSSSHFDPQTTSPSVDLTTSRPLVRNG